jgi:hypothetical protein
MQETGLAGLTPALTILPFLWQMRKNSHLHHVADIYMLVLQLGFNNVLSYLEVCGWTFKAQGGMPTIQYCKLEQVITHLAPTGNTAMLVMNFKAMVDNLYTYIEQQQIQNIYTNKPAIHFLEKTSFISKLHQQTQELQVAFIIVKIFFMAHVSSHKGEPDYWEKRIFKQCCIWRDFILFYNGMLSLFNDDGNPALAIDLLTNFTNCIWDKVSHHAMLQDHKRHYKNHLESMIGNYKKGMRGM